MLRPLCPMSLPCDIWRCVGSSWRLNIFQIPTTWNYWKVGQKIYSDLGKVMKVRCMDNMHFVKATLLSGGNGWPRLQNLRRRGSILVLVYAKARKRTRSSQAWGQKLPSWMRPMRPSKLCNWRQSRRRLRRIPWLISTSRLYKRL